MIPGALKLAHEPASYIAAAGLTSSLWIEKLNDGILVPIATVVGIVYIILKIYFVIKNRGEK